MPRVLSNVSTESIQRELRRRERTVGSLQRRHAALLGKVAALERAISAAGGSAPGGPPRAGDADGRQRRHRNKQSLVDALVTVLKNKPMSVKDAAAAVRRGGYRTVSRFFSTQVNIALIKSGKFRRVARGQYQAKPAA